MPNEINEQRLDELYTEIKRLRVENAKLRQDLDHYKELLNTALITMNNDE